MDKYELSLVLPIRGEQVALDLVLNNLLANQPDETWELIVVDDGSNTPLSLTTEPPTNWQILRNSETQGAARSRNLGAHKAQGKTLVFLSHFLRLPTDYIKQIKTFIQNNSFDFAQHLIERDPKLPATYFQDFIANQENRINSDSGNLKIKQSLFTAAIIKNEVFWSEKGFDESMQHYGGHEMDLVYRLDQAGFRQRVLINTIRLQRVKLEDHHTIQDRLHEYGSVGLPGLLKKHPELKSTILKGSIVWWLSSALGFTRATEKWISKKISGNKPLSRYLYRLYLHLIVRNAWDAR